MKLLTVHTTQELISHKATGQAAREERKEHGLSGREMARRMGLSAPYLSDLELGKRNWSVKLVKLWNNALKMKGTTI